MMQLVILCAAALLACARAANVRHPRLLAALDNQIDTQSLPTKQSRKFVALTHRLPPVTLHREGAVELTCEGIGAPAPTIRWFKNTGPIFEHNLESNEILEASASSVARITSTLIVPSVASGDDYTCLISTGYKTARSTTTVIHADGSTEQEDRINLYPLDPRILVHYKVFVDNIGNNVVLPCKVRGHPRPQITWTDNKGTTVKNDPRMKVLRSGELIITSLRWSDMGEFTCSALNAYGSHSITTFVYPAKAG